MSFQGCFLNPPSVSWFHGTFSLLGLEILQWRGKRCVREMDGGHFVRTESLSRKIDSITIIFPHIHFHSCQSGHQHNNHSPFVNYQYDDDSVVMKS